MANRSIHRREFLSLSGTALAGIARKGLGDLGRPGKNNRPAAFVEPPKPWLMPTKKATSGTAL